MKIALNVALIGCGGFARQHAQWIRRVGGRSVRLVAVSRTRENAERAAGEMKADGSLYPYQAALEAPDIDAVLIITPHHTHVELAAEALRRGKHVLLEKPVARTVAEAEPLGRAHRENPSRVLMIGEQFHFSPPINQAAEALRQGTIGKLQSVLCNGFTCVQPEGWRKRREEMGGGALIDGGVHYIHGLRMIGGEIASVYALEPAAKFNAMEGEETIQLLMRYESGATANFNYSWGYHGNPSAPVYLVVGTDGSIAYHPGAKVNALYKIGRPKPGKLPFNKPFSIGPLHRRHGDESTFAEFLDCIQTGRRPAIPLAEGLKDLAIAEAAYKSLATGQAVQVEPLPAWASLD